LDYFLNCKNFFHFFYKKKQEKFLNQSMNNSKETINLIKLSLNKLNSLVLIIIFFLCILEIYIYNFVGEISSKFSGALVTGYSLKFNYISLKKYLNTLCYSILIIIISTIIKTIREVSQDSFSNLLRKTLNQYIQEKYFENHNFYDISKIKKFDNVDMRITRDIENFSNLITSIIVFYFFFNIGNNHLKIIFF
jgi:ABC-type uncharacterized transport system fused permease/ATPase subunit